MSKKPSKETLDIYLRDLKEFFIEYESYLRHRRSSYHSYSDKQAKLQQKTHLISSIFARVHGGGSVKVEQSVWNFYDQLSFTLEESSFEYKYYDQIQSRTKRLINEAIGNIETGMIPSFETKPIIPIKDQMLQERCQDLLNAPGAFDRVIREATTVLEDRLKSSISNEELAKIIPETVNLTGDKLITRLLSPDNPVLSISDNKAERIAFFKMMQGIFAYLRNPFHHSLDEKTEWALAWSVVGLVDSLLLEISKCEKLEDIEK